MMVRYGAQVNVIVTGVAGYVGAHIAEDLLNQGFQVIGIDNYSTGKPSFVNPKINMFEADIRNVKAVQELTSLLKFEKPIGLIHAAGVKFAGESLRNPDFFYQTNTVGTLHMLEMARSLEIENFVFSSSCSVYGSVDSTLGVTEQAQLNPESPYGRSKLFAEEILRDFSNAYGITSLSLRYFNVAGNSAIPAFDLSPFNLFPNLYLSIHNKSKFKIFGANHKTPDGSCIRDYVDVRELAIAHTKTLIKMISGSHLPSVINLGSGKGFSVLEIVKTAQENIKGMNGYEIADARPGDPAAIFADTSCAEQFLDWNHTTSLSELLVSGWEAWKFQN